MFVYMQMQLINILFFRYILENLKIMKNCRTYIYSSRHSPLLKKETHLDIIMQYSRSELQKFFLGQTAWYSILQD